MLTRRFALSLILALAIGAAVPAIAAQDAAIGPAPAGSAGHAHATAEKGKKGCADSASEPKALLPGMDAAHGAAWEVLLLGSDGSLKVFSSYPAK